jgi:hypothetical protein
MNDCAAVNVGLDVRVRQKRFRGHEGLEGCRTLYAFFRLWTQDHGGISGRQD